jgi:hypothetical protein
MIFGALGVLFILAIAIWDSGNVSKKTSKNLQDYYKENPLQSLIDARYEREESSGESFLR